MNARGAPLMGLMQDWPLTVDRFLDHARLSYPWREIVSRRPDGGVERRTYADLFIDAKRLSSALVAYGVNKGDRVATLASNTADHMAAWFAICGIGAVCHTLNPRMAADKVAFIVNHAQDRLIFADAAYAPMLAEVLASCPCVEKVVFFTPPDAATKLAAPFETLEAFVYGRGADCVWGDFEENAAAGLCYTSGTTGDPKGVLYSHRSNYLHALMTVQPDIFDLGVRETVMPVVPMYHANAWGFIFSAPAVGAKLVLPGARLDAASLYELMEAEGVTLAAGVPTVWLSLVQFLQEKKVRPWALTRVIVGGAACPQRLIEDFRALAINAIHAWGMTEMSPVGVVGTLTPEVAALPFERQLPYRIKQGRAPCGVEFKVVKDDGAVAPRDGKSIGGLRVRGPAIVAKYFRDEREILDEDGFFETGDIATLDPQGFMQITDRAKDIIKSGGEWISSIEIENAALQHPAIANAAVIGVSDVKWGERPLLLAVLKLGESVDKPALLGFLGGKLVKWQLPGDVAFLQELPLGPTGKVDKKRLREMWATADSTRA